MGWLRWVREEDLEHALAQLPKRPRRRETVEEFVARGGVVTRCPALSPRALAHLDELRKGLKRCLKLSADRQQRCRANRRRGGGSA